MIWTVLVGSDLVTPPLLTARVSALFPIGHIRFALAPEAVPQLPVQVSVTGQLSGSVADPLRVTLAPLALIPLAVWLEPAFAVGSVAVIAASASRSPKPSILFGTV